MGSRGSKHKGGQGPAARSLRVSLHPHAAGRGGTAGAGSAAQQAGSVTTGCGGPGRRPGQPHGGEGPAPAARPSRARPLRLGCSPPSGSLHWAISPNSNPRPEEDRQRPRAGGVWRNEGCPCSPKPAATRGRSSRLSLRCATSAVPTPAQPGLSWSPNKQPARPAMLWLTPGTLSTWSTGYGDKMMAERTGQGSCPPRPRPPPAQASAYIAPCVTSTARC